MFPDELCLVNCLQLSTQQWPSSQYKTPLQMHPLPHRWSFHHSSAPSTALAAGGIPYQVQTGWSFWVQNSLARIVTSWLQPVTPLAKVINILYNSQWHDALIPSPAKLHRNAEWIVSLELGWVVVSQQTCRTAQVGNCQQSTHTHTYTTVVPWIS